MAQVLGTSGRRAAASVAAALPAVELHLHLDGSLPAQFVRKRAVERGLVDTSHELHNEAPMAPGNDPHAGPSAARRWLHAIKAGQSAHAVQGANWQVFDVCNAMLQQREELHEATVAVAETLRNVHKGRHLELRFCPHLHTQEGLEVDEVLAIVCDALASVQGLTGGVIVCGLRSHAPSIVREAAALACAFRDKGVIGFDIAGDEASFPLQPHAEAIRMCQRAGLMVTVHAGETGLASDMENLAMALSLEVDRIGHGWAIARDSGLLRRAVDQRVTFECCLTANIRPNRVRTYAAHPVRHLLKAGARVTLNSDNLMLSGTEQTLIAAPARERQAAVEHLGFQSNDLARVTMNAAKAARGISEAERHVLISDVLSVLQNAART